MNVSAWNQNLLHVQSLVRKLARFLGRKMSQLVNFGDRFWTYCAEKKSIPKKPFCTNLTENKD